MKPFLLLAMLSTAAGAPQQRPEVALAPVAGAALPADVLLADDAGVQRPLSQWLDGRPAVLVFGYLSCPMLCPAVLDELSSALAAGGVEPGRDAAAIFISIDPADTAADAAARRRRLEAGGGSWAVLLGDAASVDRLASAAGFGFESDGSGQYAHAAAVYVLTPEGRVSRVFQGLELPARDVRLAVVEAGEGRIGSVGDRLLLLCAEWDPATGRYGMAILGALRVLGLATAGGVAAFVGVALVRERRRTR